MHRFRKGIRRGWIRGLVPGLRLGLSADGGPAGKESTLALSPLAFWLAWGLAAPAASLVVCDNVDQPPSLNPYQVFSEKVHTVLQQVLEGLLRFGPDGQFEPALAVRWERTGPLSVRFMLRRGVRFHNGEPFDARSVKFSIEKYVDPETRFPGFPFVQALERVDMLDEHTVEVVTRVPDGLLLNRLAAWVHIVPPDYYSRSGASVFARHPVGTGPFRFEEWKEGKEIRLARNDDYWMEGRPHVEELTFRFIPADRQLKELLAGRVDILTELPGTATFSIVKTGKFEVVKKKTLYTLAGSFKVNRGPTADKRVRLALNYGTDRAELIRYDLMGNGAPLATYSMPGEEGHDEGLRPFPYDPRKARELLREAGHEKLRLKALVKNTGTRTASILKAQWRKIGVDLEYHVRPEDVFFRELRSADVDLAFGGCPDPMVHSYFIQGISLFSKSPFSIVNIPEYDRRLLGVVSAVDDKARKELAEELDRFVYEEVLGLFTYQKIKTHGVRKGITFTPYVTGMPYFFSTEILDPTARSGP